MLGSNLSLRKRKLLDYIQRQPDFITGNDLAAYLQVSTRTIRSDVIEINEHLAGSGIEIISKRSQGYKLNVENKNTLKELNKSTNSFLSREDRIRHIAFRLCLSDSPIDLYDLEDEMFISRTTLEHDLIELRKKYVLPSPHIEFIRYKNHISFEQDERKRRTLLTLLYIDNWDYNSRGNTFYQYQYFDESIINLITDEIQFFLAKNRIMMDDISIVVLDLLITISYYRLQSNHELEPSAVNINYEHSSRFAVDELLDEIESKLNCTFPDVERNEIYLHIYCGSLLDASKLNFGTVVSYFDASTIAFADAYIQKIYNTYEINFADDEDFYITLLQYLRYLSLPIHYLNDVGRQSNTTRSNMLIEYEIAFLIQELALQYTGNYLDHIELMYLAFCISGALEYRNRNLRKLKTVVMCHMNLPACWNLKQKLLTSVNDHIDIIALLPVNYKGVYDFSKIDLIITTVNKPIASNEDCELFISSPYFNEQDQQNLENLIFRKRIHSMYHPNLPDLSQLLEQAFWHEKNNETNSFSLIEQLAMDFINEQYVSYDYLQQILRREATMSFVTQPGIVLMYSLSPSRKTCLSIATLEHRIRWHSQKIRCVIMVAIRPEHKTLIFKLINEILYKNIDINQLKFMKSREEITSLLLK